MNHFTVTAMDQDSSNSNFTTTSNTQEFPLVLDSENYNNVENSAEEIKSKEKFNVGCLSYELQVGYRILSNLMGTGNRCVNSLFLHPIDDTYPETTDYYDKIKKPMWMFKMKEKFEKQEYKDLAEFMSDFRLMIENCYRYNGPDCSVSKKAQKLEMMMKQKVALLSRDLRDKISKMSANNSDDDILALAGVRRRIKNPNAPLDDPSQQLLSQLRRDRELQEKVCRRQKMEDRKAVELARIQELQVWEDKLLGPEVKEKIKTMWELPQIGLFVYLCMESLGLEEEVTQYQIERGLAIPRECSDFQRLITCLLSTPHQRKSLKGFMPYYVWNAKLTRKLDYFYRVLSDSNGNQMQACFLLGLDTRAFKIMGKSNPMLKKKFHELSYLKRVWILKNFCDFCLETQPYLQKTIEDIEAVRPMDVREVQLGSDGRGNCYINFPMFTGKDIRIYRHSKHSEPTLKSLHMEGWAIETSKMSASLSTCSTPINQRTGHMTKSASARARARALLQNVESKEASPRIETPQVALGTSKIKSSNGWTPNSNTNCVNAGKQSSAKKRKRTGLYFSKRKRLKPDRKDISQNKKKLNENETLDEEKQEENGINVSNGFSDASAVGVQYIAENSLSTVCNKMDKVINSSTHACSDNPLTNKMFSPATDTEKFSVKSDTTKEQAVTQDISAVSICDNLISSINLNKSVSNGIPQESSKHQCCDFQNDIGQSLESSISSDIKAEDSHVNCNQNSLVKDENTFEVGNYPCIAESVNKIRSEQTVKELNGFVKTEIITNIGVNSLICENDIFSPTKQQLFSLDKNMLLPNNRNLEISNKQESNKEEIDHMLGLCNNIHSDFVGDRNEIKDSISSSGDVLDVKMENDLNLSVKEEGTKLHTMDNSQSLENHLDIKGVSEEGNPSVKTDAAKEEAERMAKTEEEDSDIEDLPHLGTVELVAESMEDIRHLIHKISNPEPTKKGKKLIPGVVKPCDEDLMASLSGFMEELTKYERSLCNARLEMQAKLRRDIERYVEPKLEEVKDWESDNSHSSKDSSEDEECDSRAGIESSAKQTKKGKQKPTTSTLLTSAASKLSSSASKVSSLNEERNEDSNDSFELDISSRGRLRKRRIIPNNTEDTGLKRRKNLQNQDSLFPISTSSATITTTAATPAFGHQDLGKPVPSTIVSLLKSNAGNFSMKTHLAPKTSGTDGQLAHLLSPLSDNTCNQTLIGKSGLIRTSLNLSNICVVSSPGPNTVPRNKLLATSSAQHSHPVIQQMLKQTRSSQPLTITTSSFTTMISSGLSQHLSRTRTAIQAPSSSIPKTSTIVIKVPSSAITSAVTKSVNIISQSPASVAVTMVSPSVSQGGKQVIDLGSLSISQLQQLIKNQTVQINTGDGGPAMLILTAGLQQSSALSSGTQPSIVTGTPVSLSTETPAHGKLPVNHTVPLERVRTPGVSSLLAVGNSVQAAATSLSSSKFSPLTFPKETLRKVVISNVPTTQPHTYVKINTPSISQTSGALFHELNTSPLQTALSRTTSLIPSVSSTVLASSTQLGPISKNAHNVCVKSLLPLTAAQKHIPVPRIINSLAPTNLPAKMTLGVNSALSAQASSGNYSVVISNSNSGALNPDTLKSRIITVPLVHLSPSKNSACNLTVKALLENRGAKRCKEDDSNTSACEPQKLLSSFTNNSTLAVSDEDFNIKDVSFSTSVKNDKGESDVDKTFSHNDAFEILEEDRSCTSTTNIHGQANGTSTFVSTAVNSLTLPLSISVDTPFSSISTFPSEINLPTMNIKVPCPGTLPSLQHNKNGTTIVQSTKVPIPVATEAKSGDSLSPSNNAGSANVHQDTVLQAVSTSSRVHPAVENLVVLPGENTTILSTVRAANSSSALPENSSQLTASVTGLKNIMLKVTPQGQGSGQLVQGFMTSRGLVIPQTALLQQNNQAGSGAVLPTTALTHLQPGCVQIQPSAVLGTGKQQTVLNFNTCQGSITGQDMKQQHQQLAKNIFVAAPTLASDLSHNIKPSIQVMLLKAPSMSTVYPISSTTSVINQQKETTTTTPASELVKQIVSNTQALAGLQQKVTVDAKSEGLGNSQQNAVQLLNNIVQASGLHHGNNNASLSVQKVANIPTTINSHLTTQVLTLQQNKRLQEQQQGNIVLTAQPMVNQGVLPSQTKHPAVTFQIQQSGPMSNFTGATHIVGGVQQIQQSQGTSIQQLLGPRVAHPNQVLQLAIRQPNEAKVIQAATNHSQTIHLSGQQSSQPVLTNQRLALLQPNGKIVIQQPSNQRVLLQPALASNTIQPSIGQLQLNILQQHSSPLQSAQRPHAPTTVSKDQFISSVPIQSQQLVNTPRDPNLIISQLQVPAASLASGSFAQQTQFFINPSTSSLSVLPFSSTSTVSPSVNKIQMGTLVGNINHTRADSSCILNSHPTGIQVISSRNEFNHNMTPGNSILNVSSLAAKSDPSLTIPNTRVGQFIVSPIKLNSQNQHMNITNPLRVVYAHTQGSNSTSGQTSGSVMMNSQLLNKSMASPSAANQENSGSLRESLLNVQNNFLNQASVKPAVIYAGQSSIASDVKEGGIAQILQSPAASLKSVQVNNTLQPVASLHPNSSGAQLRPDINSSLTFVYKFGDQYFTPATNVGQLIPQTSLSATSMATPGIVTTSKSDVQLLVPPSFIEASDNILKQSIKTQPRVPHIPSIASSSTESVLGSTNLNENLLKGKDIKQTPVVTSDLTSQNLKASVNGAHMASTQISFSLSGPVSINSKQPITVCDASGSILGETSPGTVNPENSGSVFESLLNIQNLHSASVNIPPVRRNPFASGQNVLNCLKGPVTQRHLSSDDVSHTLEDQDEKEAAMNLLTLANQQI